MERSAGLTGASLNMVAEVSASPVSSCVGHRLDGIDDLSPLGLVLFLAQQARVTKFLELPELDARVTPGLCGRWGRSTS
jgi:hypothetical protein